jgi:hypothetical protein
MVGNSSAVQVDRRASEDPTALVWIVIHFYLDQIEWKRLTFAYFRRFPMLWSPWIARTLYYFFPSRSGKEPHWMPIITDDSFLYGN